MKHLSGYKPPSVKTVRQDDGDLTNTPEEYAAQFFKHFKGVFDAEVFANLQDLSNSDRAGPCWHGTPTASVPSLQRVVNALARLPLKKAVGPDGIPSEILRVGGIVLASLLHKILHKIWDQGYWPLR